MDKTDANVNNAIKLYFNNYIDSASFDDNGIDPKSIPEVMKYRDFERVIKENGIDDKFTRAKFHFYQTKGLVSKGERLKENQARYTRDQFFEYAFAHMIAEHNSIENAVSIIRMIRSDLVESDSDSSGFMDLVSSFLDMVKQAELAIPETIPVLVDTLLDADDSTQFSEQERKGLITFLELTYALSYQKAAAKIMKKFVDKEGGEQL